MPTVPKLPHKLGSRISVEDMYNYDALTVLANLAEIPAISVPCGRIDGVPVGMQILCKRFDDSKTHLLRPLIEAKYHIQHHNQTLRGYLF